MNTWAGRIVPRLLLVAVTLWLEFLAPLRLAAASGPGITTQPQDQRVLVGSNAVFTVVASGQTPLFYQWYFNGAPMTDGGRVTGSATTNLVIADVQTNDAGSYQIIVTNNYGSATSMVAVLSIASPPQIINQPLSQSAVRNNHAVLTVGTSGTPPLSYQWYFNGTPLADGGRIIGSITTNLTIANVQTNDGGIYQVVVSNSFGSLWSTNANLTVVRSMVIGWGVVGVPPDATNIVAISAKGSLLALKGDGTIAGIPGYNNLVAFASGYSHDLALAGDGTIYGWGDNSSGEINIPPGLTNAVALGAGLQHSLALNNDGTVSAWGYDGYGETSVPSNVLNVRAIAAGAWNSMALDNDGNVFEWGANYGNVPAGLGPVVAVSGGYDYNMALRADGTIVAWGNNEAGQLNIPAGLSNVVAISAGPAAAFALKRDGTVVAWGNDYDGVTDIPVGLSNVVAVVGGWDFTAAVINDGSPWFAEIPTDRTVYSGSTATFNSTITGQEPFSYQWQSNGVVIAGATNATLVLTHVQASQAGQYDLIVSNAIGTVTSPIANLSVLPTQPVAIQPLNLTTNAGATVTFTSSVVGQVPFTYQWQFNGTNLPGATNSSLTLSNVALNQSGLYSVTTSNRYGSTTSSNAALTVFPWITPSISPNTATMGSGTVVVFTLTSGGLLSNATYQWYFNGNLFMTWTNSGAGADLIPIMSNAGNYYVVGSDSYTTVTSAVVTLTVIPLAITAPPTNRETWLGGNTRFSMTAIGATPISYQWRFSRANLPGANTNVLTLTNVQASQFGTYDVVVADAYTSITSTATLSLSQVAVWGGAYGESNLTAGLTNIIAIAGGENGSLDCAALQGNGTAINWPAQQMAGVSNLIAIADAGPGFGLKSNGTVVEWSYDGASPISGLSNIVAISGFGSSYLALRSNGTAVANPTGAPPAAATNLVAVALGGGHDLGLRADGTVMAWGNNSSGQATVPPGLSNVIAIAAGGYHSLALKSDGTVIGWGLNNNGQTNIPPNLSNVVAIAAGGYHSLALTANGTVVAWGLNAFGQTNVPSGLSNVIAIAAGQYHSLALIGNGPPMTHALLGNPNFGTNGLNMSLPTQSGRVYVLQYKSTLADSNWISLPPTAGIGNLLLLTDPTATNSQRFYRVQRW